jgi:hypothetical protein
MIEPIHLDPTRARHAGSALAQAFQDDPMYRYVCPDPEERRRTTAPLFEAAVKPSLAFGEAWTTPDLNGAALWLAPGNTSLNFWHIARTGFVMVFAIMR